MEKIERLRDALRVASQIPFTPEEVGFAAEGEFRVFANLIAAEELALAERWLLRASRKAESYGQVYQALSMLHVGLEKIGSSDEVEKEIERLKTIAEKSRL